MCNRHAKEGPQMVDGSLSWLIHVLQYSIHYISTYIKPFYLSLHDKRIRQNVFHMCLLRKTQHCRIRVCWGVEQSRVPSGRWESRSIWHQMLTNIWVHNIGSCMISSYPSLHQRKSDWNRISCENFAEISISEPFRSQPGSQMADRSQAFQMSIDAASATYLVWYHLCVNLWGILGKITVGIWLVPEALRSASVRKMLFLKRTPCKWYRAHEGLKWRMGDTCSKQRYMIFKHKKFVADYLSCSDLRAMIFICLSLVSKNWIELASGTHYV